MFKQLQPIEFRNGVDKIAFLAEFAKYRGEKALGTLKGEICSATVRDPLSLVQILEKGYLRQFSDADLDNILTVVDEQGTIDRETAVNAPLQTLKRLAKRR